MSSMPDGIGAVERVAEYLEDADVDVCSLRDCETSTDGKRVRATIDVEARVDVLAESGDSPGAKEVETADGPDAGGGSAVEARGDRTEEDTSGEESPPETRCAGAPVVGYEDLTPAKQDLVDALADGPLSSAQAAEMVDIKQQTASTYLSGLENAGLVTADPDPEDGRRQLYSLVDNDGADTEPDAEAEVDAEALQEQPEQNDDAVGGIDWLDRAPEEIVADSPASRSLDEVVAAIEQNDNRIDIGQRLGLSALSQTRRLLKELGLSTDCDDVDDEDEIDERLAQLRDYVDRQEVTA
jgi:DNA-binding transcriptional ArsR family regulator